MEYRRLGLTDLNVSVICLGTMTYGQQNTEAEGFEQMDYALDQGVNFFDTAELYAIPPSEETYGRTEEVIGNWFQARNNRDKVILASKIAGPSAHLPWIRGVDNDFAPDHLDAALNDSLKRLQTDYIDLYQLHWPERPMNMFGTLGFSNQEIADDTEERMFKTLQHLDGLIKSGKVRHWGLSNESAWGTMKFIQMAEKHGFARPVSVQNPYNLLNRSYEVGLSEVSIRENCGLLAYSPLARGTLTGKYLNGQMPEGSSRSIDSRGSRYDNAQGEAATQAYYALAQAQGIDPAQLAIAFINQQAFVTSNIIGATKMEQLKVNIAAKDLTLSDEVLVHLEKIHHLYTYPCP